MQLSIVKFLSLKKIMLLLLLKTTLESINPWLMTTSPLSASILISKAETNK